MMTQERIFWLLDKRGPMKGCDIARRLNLKRMAVYKALGALYDKGCVVRSDDKVWHRKYSLAPGAMPPDDGRGQAPASRVALSKYRHAASDWWKPCPLAELLPLSLGGKRAQEYFVDAGGPNTPIENVTAASAAVCIS